MPKAGARGAGRGALVIPTAADASATKRRKKAAGGKVGGGEEEPQDHSPRNFLVAGGGRAVERERGERLAQLSRSALADLRTANAALASELVRVRGEHDEERGDLLQKTQMLSSGLKDEQESKAHMEADLKALQQRTKELQKKLRDEHFLRTKSEQDVADMQEESSRLRSSIAQMEGEKASSTEIVAHLKDSQKDLQKELADSRKELCEAKCNLLHAEKRLELQLRDHNDLMARQAVLDSMVKSLSERGRTLAEALNGAECQMRSMKANADAAAAEASGGMKQLQKEVNDLRRDLAAECDKQKECSEEIASLRRVISEQQAQISREQDEAANNKAEAERLVRESERIRKTLEACRSTTHTLEAENGHLKSSLASERKRCQEAACSLEAERSAHQATRVEFEAKEKDLIMGSRAREEELKSENEALEAALMSESRLKEQQAKDAQDMANLMDESLAKLRLENSKLTVRVDAMDTELRESQEATAAMKRERDEAISNLSRTEEMLSKSEERSISNAMCHSDQMSRLQQSLQDERQNAARWREESESLAMQVEAKNRESEAASKHYTRAIAERDSQLEQFADSLTSVSERLKTTNAASLDEKKKFKQQIEDLENDRSRMQQEISDLRREVAASAESCTLRQREADQVSHMLDEREAEMQTLRNKLEEERDQRCRLQEEVASNLEAHRLEMESKSKMVNDLLSAMQSEESAKIESHQKLMVAAQRVKSLERELGTTRSSLNTAKSDADSALEAYESMKKKANSYRQENQTLLSNYDAWITGDGKEAQPLQARKSGAWAAVRSKVLDRSDSSRYSDRISALLQKRNSVKK